MPVNLAQFQLPGRVQERLNTLLDEQNLGQPERASTKVIWEMSIFQTACTGAG